MLIGNNAEKRHRAIKLNNLLKRLLRQATGACKTLTDILKVTTKK